MDSEACKKGNIQVPPTVQATTRNMTGVQNAEEGIKHITWLVYPLLSALGAWPTNVKSSVPLKIRKWLLILFIYIVQLAIVIPSILYIILKVKNNRTRVKLIMPNFSSVCQLLKYTIVLRRHNEIRQLVNDLRNDWLNATEEDQWIYKTRATIGHRLVLSFMIFLYTGGTSLRAITPLLREKIVLPNNMTLRPLPCPGYFFFNDQLSPIYEILYFVQVFCGFLSYTTLSGTLALCSMLCLHMCSMLRILGSKMNDLTNLLKMDEDTVQKKIKDIVKYHTKFRGYFNRAEHVTSFIYFVQMSCDMMIMCISGYSVIMEWENSNAVGLITYFILQITTMIGSFTNCYIGQLFIDEGDAVKEISNTLDWYRLPVKKIRSLIMIIIVSNNPMKVTAANIIHLSLITFTDITKTTMGYFNVLRSTV